MTTIDPSLNGDTRMTDKPPYTVQMDHSNVCLHCRRRDVWTVIGPDGARVGSCLWNYPSQYEAEHMADELSRAYRAGKLAQIRESLAALSPPAETYAERHARECWKDDQLLP